MTTSSDWVYKCFINVNNLIKIGKQKFMLVTHGGKRKQFFSERENDFLTQSIFVVQFHPQPFLYRQLKLKFKLARPTQEQTPHTEKPSFQPCIPSLAESMSRSALERRQLRRDADKF